MKVYHFLDDGLAEHMFENFIRHYGSMDDLLKAKGWQLSEDLEMVYTAWVPSENAEQADRDGLFSEYAYVFQVEDISSTMPWAVLVRNDPNEYMKFMRMVEPLFSRAQYLSGAPSA
jgi:hypothetical protein